MEIRKPDGGIRKLGIPCGADRLIQQAVLQVLQKRWDPTFSEHRYGFRPGRSAHQAVGQAQTYVAEGYTWVVALDREPFFDRVKQDRLMARVATRVSDKRVLKLIRAFRSAGMMENGWVSPTDEGVPQGGPLSPLLSILLLDDLDQELARRGHRFVRYPFWKRWGLDAILTDVGLTARARMRTCVMTINRLVHPSSRMTLKRSS